MGYLLYDSTGDSWLFAYLNFTAVATIAIMVQSGYNEYSDNTIFAYSKFSDKAKGLGMKVTTRTGMFIVYSPAALVALLYLSYKLEYVRAPAVFGSIFARKNNVEETSLRLWVMTTAVLLHFIKRILEVAFVHRASGQMELGLGAFTGFCYSQYAANCLLAQELADKLVPPSVNLLWAGVGCFIIGQIGNGYHHYLLAHLRKDGSKKYVVPHGGCFELLVVPNYTFEIITFCGLFLIGQTLSALAIFIATTLLLTGRAYNTRSWYYQKLENFPRDRKLMIPYVW